MMSIKGTTMFIATRRPIATAVIETLVNVVVAMSLTMVTNRKPAKEQTMISATTSHQKTFVTTSISASMTEQHMRIFDVSSTIPYTPPWVKALFSTPPTSHLALQFQVRKA